MSTSKLFKLKPFFIGSIGIGIGVTIERLRNTGSVSAATALPATTRDHLRGIDTVDSYPTKSLVSNYTTKGERINEIIRHHGYPASDTIRVYDNYVLSYDRRNRTANWVMEHLNPALLDHPGSKFVDRSKCEFKEDPQVHSYFRSSNQDYLHSGFDRGHLAAAGNHKVSQDIIDQTFYLSNISPQVGKGFNRDAWNNLERYVRYRAKRSKNLWVCTGPLYLPRKDPSDGKLYIKYQVIGPNNVSVPTHFFKALIVENVDGSIDLESYVMANQVLDSSIPMRSYQVPLESVERAAGFLIFSQVPKSVFKSINSYNKFLEKFDKSLLLETSQQQSRARG